MPKDTFDYCCKNCDHEFTLDIEYTPYIPAQTYGPPENCYPEEGGDFDIIKNDHCPKCDSKVDNDSVKTEFFESQEDRNI